jgi:predicted NBD/HSP70 family sugar kinase
VQGAINGPLHSSGGQGHIPQGRNGGVDNCVHRVILPLVFLLSALLKVAALSGAFS